jgi:acetyl esterase/lipase
VSFERRVRARIRALVLIAVVLDVPVLARLVTRLTPTPRVEALEVDGVPVQVVRPPDDRPRPAWVFVNGAHPLRRREPVVWRLAQGLARAGYLVAVPDIPGLGEGTITSRTVGATEAVTRAACERPDVLGGRVALIGASTGAGLALLAAGSPELARRVSVVAAVAPFADLRKLICLTTTGSYADADGFVRHDVTRPPSHGGRPLSSPRSRQVGIGSACSPSSPGSRNRSSTRCRSCRGARRGWKATGVPSSRCWANREPRRYDELYEALPPAVSRFIDELSPLHVGGAIQARIEVVVPPSDVYFPLAEAVALADALPNVRLTVTRTLDHTRPTASLTRLRDFAAFGRFVVRGLAAAG